MSRSYHRLVCMSVALICSIAPLAAGAQVTYRLAELPVLSPSGGGLSIANAINNRGDVVGRSRNDDALLVAAVWTDGRVIEVGTEHPSSAEGVNNRLDVVGTIPGQGAFHWRRGRLTILNAGERSDARDVNERGQLVGAACESNEFDCFAALWERKDLFAPERLPGSRSNDGTGVAINNRGEVVGAMSGPLGFTTPVLWQGGVAIFLSPLESGGATDINNHGQIVGMVSARAVMWQEREQVLLPGPAGHTEFLQSFARAINNRGVIVGFSFDPGPAGGGEQHAVVWQNGNITDLNDVIADDLAEFITLTDAVDVNERGQIAVNGFDSRLGAGRAYVLTPVRP